MSKYLVAALLAVFSLSAAAQVSKCTVNGKTVYTDQNCPSGTAKQFEMHHTAGTVSPDRHTIDDTLERARLKRWVEEEPGRSATRSTTRNGKTFEHTYNNPLPMRTSGSASSNRQACNAYAERIKYLEDMARQPQSGSTQDWIKVEKAKTQTQIYNAKC